MDWYSLRLVEHIEARQQNKKEKLERVVKARVNGAYLFIWFNGVQVAEKINRC